MQDDPIGAVGEGRTRVTGVAEFDLGQTVADDEPSPGIVEHDIEEAQRPAERLTQRRRMQHRVAEQREAAAAHRPCAHAEEFIVELGGDRQPERAIGLCRNRLIDRGCQADAGKDRRRRLAEPPQAVECLLHEARRDHASFDLGHSIPAMAKLAEIMEQFCHRLQ